VGSVADASIEASLDADQRLGEGCAGYTRSPVQWGIGQRAVPIPERPYSLSTNAD